MCQFSAEMRLPSSTGSACVLSNSCNCLFLQQPLAGLVPRHRLPDGNYRMCACETNKTYCSVRVLVRNHIDPIALPVAWNAC